MITLPNGQQVYSKNELTAQGYGGYVGWNDPEAGLDFAATGGGGKWTGGTTTGGGGEISPFNFDWTQSEKDALEKLRPYYEEVLAESQGDVNLAKSRLEEDYQLGKRYREEDLTFQTRGAQMEEPIEKEKMLSGLNQRGFLQSTVRTQEQIDLEERQARRREAIQRAIQRKEEVAGIEKGRQLTDITTKEQRYERDIGEEKKEKAAAMAEQKYGRDYQRFMAEASRYIGA